MNNVTYVNNDNVKMVCNVGIDLSDLDKDKSYIIMRRSDNSLIHLSIDDVDTDNNNVIHNSTESDFNVEGTYLVQPYLVFTDDDGNVTAKYLCDEDTFYVKGRI